MAKTLQTLGPHNLKTDKLEELAKELSSILERTIHYGYKSNVFLSNLRELYGLKIASYPELFSDFYELGVIEYPGIEADLYLSENDYEVKYFNEIFHNQNLNNEFFKTGMIREFKDVLFETDVDIYFELEAPDSTEAYIFKHCIEISADYFEWWRIREIFNCDSSISKSTRNWFADVICEQRSEYKKFNKGEFLIFCFETNSVIAQDLAYEGKTWSEILEIVNKKFKQHFLNITDFIVDSACSNNFSGSKMNKEKIENHLKNRLAQYGNDQKYYEIYYDKFY